MNPIDIAIGVIVAVVILAAAPSVLRWIVDMLGALWIGLTRW